jgi:hypothetical protein
MHLACLKHGAGAALTHVTIKSLVYGCISTRAGYLLSPCSKLVLLAGTAPASKPHQGLIMLLYYRSIGFGALMAT